MKRFRIPGPASSYGTFRASVEKSARAGYDHGIDRRRIIVVAVLLVTGTLAVYAPVTQFGFVDYDDRTYVSENPQVQRGLTWATVAWALTAKVASHWHPLTMMSHALDWTLFGAWAGGHHAVNVALHAGNVLLLFALLLRTTAAPGRSALVAGLFALHPLRVESVAWVAERKDVLSAAFFLGALNAYVGWVRRPSVARYAVLALLFAAGLLAKSMVLTLPLVLLLLDHWPLARPVPRSRLVAEKVPLFVLALASLLTTLLAAHESAMAPLAHVSAGARLENAVVSLAWYLAKTVWPSGLAVLYLHPAAPGGVAVTWLALAVSLAVFAGVSVWVLRERRYPYLLTGWGWYLVMLLPVLGVVQAGIQARADRYTYLPLIGPCIMVVWRAGDWLAQRTLGPAARTGLAAALITLLIGYASLTLGQLMVWRDSESLYRHAIAVEPRNFMMHVNLGTVLGAARRSDEALVAFERALEIHPRYALAHRLLGTELERAGRLDDAIARYHEAARLDPADAASFRLLGDALLAHGEPEPAIAAYRRALTIDAADAHTHNNLGNALLAAGDAAEAGASYQRALALDPSLEGAHGNLAARLEAAGDWVAVLEHRRAHARLDPASAEAQQALARALLHIGESGPALSALREALRLDPKRTDTRQLLAWVLATRPTATAADGAEALRLAEGAGAPDAPDAAALTTLAVAQAAAGRFSDALETTARARERAVAAGETDLVRALDEMRERFRRGEPYRDAS